MKIHILFALPLLCLVAPAFALSTTEARTAYEQNRVGEAERLYRELAADESAPVADRTTAERELGRIAWLMDGSDRVALEHLEAATALRDRPCLTSQLIARVLQESHRSSEAVARSGADRRL